MYEELEQFAGCFFGEDFKFEFASADDAVAAFIGDQGSDAVRRLIPELDALLASSLTEQEIEHLWINRLFGSYEPSDDGLTYREWFAHVRDLLTQSRNG